MDKLIYTNREDQQFEITPKDKVIDRLILPLDRFDIKIWSCGVVCRNYRRSRFD